MTKSKSKPLSITVIGADGAVGSRIVRQASDRGWQVTASTQKLTGHEDIHPGVTWVENDILNPDTLADHLRGRDGVLNAMGLDAGPQTMLFPPPLYTQGTLNLIEAMRQSDMVRLVTISASFVETMDRGPVWFRIAAQIGLRAIFREMAEMERILKATQDIQWTAVRPGWLLDEGPGGDIAITDGTIPRDLIRTRTGDLADFMLDCVAQDLHIRETPAIAAPEPDHKSGPHAVLKEMIG